MAFPFLSFLFLFFLCIHGASAVSEAAVEYLYPPFMASNLLYFDTNGVFLTSQNGTFQATIYKPGTQQERYYFSLLHTPSSTVVWTANRDVPMSDRSSTVNLTPEGLSASYPNGSALWSTPTLSSPIFSLRLLDTGNLILLDAANSSLWQSFDHATDTLLSGQLLPSTSFLSSSTSDTDLSVGDYQLNVTKTDAVLSWLGSIYWRMSNDLNSIKDANAQVTFLTTNDSGLYLLTSTNSVVYEITLPSAPLRIVKLCSNGQLKITSYPSANSSNTLSNVFTAPSDACDLPLTCGSLGLCLAQGNSSSCTCPPNFASSAHSSGCSPANGCLLASNSSCEQLDNSQITYMPMAGGTTYFANKFTTATSSGNNVSYCQTICTRNCTCVGYFYKDSSQSCFLLQQPLGTLVNSSDVHWKGYAKVIKSNVSNSTNGSSSTKLLAILLPSVAAFLAVLVVGGATNIWWRKKQKNKMNNSKSSLSNEVLHASTSWPISDSGLLFSENGDYIEELLLPGLPTRFTFEELEAVTNNYRTKIGSGGYGVVYKGELEDGSLVAVKKMEGAGLRGRKEFCTEIAVIGNIHHVNLVRLRGYCAQSSHRLLVYEYMNRGSLDQSLFRPTTLLEWSERVNVAIGAACGLAYLHSGCQPKIVHCDVKPENILLDDQGQVKISDFGLAKLMTPEQSGLFTTMRGTRGYLAPEWLTNTSISDRTDVYSFGMVLLELVRGRKNRNESISETENSSNKSFGSRRRGTEYFPFIALEKHEQKSYAELIDPRLKGSFKVDEVERMVKTALCCLHEDPALRPSMTSVVAMLEGTMGVWEPRVEALGFLRIYGRGYGDNTFQIDDEFMMDRMDASRASSTSNSMWPSYLSSNRLSGPR
ncbi:hypothetical protein LUZ60_001287 [Juncus effusus]|nr:hypothetical protein LUZ60_001287 [Juncus effusus]